MKRIAVFNLKGGVGKTTTVYNLAAVKAMQGKNVLMVDFDPSRSLTIACGMQATDYGACAVCGALAKTPPDECCHTVDVSGLDNLYLLPGERNLRNYSTKLKRTRLSEVLDSLEAYFDYCFIDCPPQESDLTKNVLQAAEQVIIPCETTYLSYCGLLDVMAAIDEAKDSGNPTIRVKGVIATLYDGRAKNDREILEAMKEDPSISLIGVVKVSADADRLVHLGLPSVIGSKRSSVASTYRTIAETI